MAERIPLPKPALTQHPSGNVYFSPQQMHQYAAEARKAALKEVTAELESLYQSIDVPYAGLHADGKRDAYGEFQGWVERLMERKQ